MRQKFWNYVAVGKKCSSASLHSKIRENQAKCVTDGGSNG